LAIINPYVVRRKTETRNLLLADKLCTTGNMAAVNAHVDLYIFLEHHVRCTVHALPGGRDPVVQRAGGRRLGDGKTAR